MEVGAGVEGIAEGDLVAVEPIEWCGSCSRCAAGFPHLCDRLAACGVNRHGGGLAEYTVVPARMAHPVPEGVGTELAALAEPMAVAFHGVMRAALVPGQTAVVHGAGPIGIGALLGLRAEGIEDVVVVEPSPVRRDAVERLGAALVIDPTRTDAAAAILDHTDGRGANAHLDAAGVPASFATSIASAAARARVVAIAVFQGPVPFNPRDIMNREIEITTSRAYHGEYPRVLEHMANGRYPTDGWVTHLPLDRVVEGIETLHEQQAMKILVDAA